MTFITKIILPKSYYVTNINGEREVLSLNEDDLREIYLAYGDGQGCLLDGYFCERLTKADLEIETKMKEFGSCSFCCGTVVAESRKVSYEGKILKNHDPSWGACWDCGAI